MDCFAWGQASTDDEVAVCADVCKAFAILVYHPQTMFAHNLLVSSNLLLLSLASKSPSIIMTRSFSFTLSTISVSGRSILVLVTWIVSRSIILDDMAGVFRCLVLNLAIIILAFIGSYKIMALRDSDFNIKGCGAPSS